MRMRNHYRKSEERQGRPKARKAKKNERIRSDLLLSALLESTGSGMKEPLLQFIIFNEKELTDHRPAIGAHCVPAATLFNAIAH